MNCDAMNKMFAKSLEINVIFTMYQNVDVNNMLSSTDNTIFACVGSLLLLSTSFTIMKPGISMLKTVTVIKRIQFAVGMESQFSIYISFIGDVKKASKNTMNAAISIFSCGNANILVNSVVFSSFLIVKWYTKAEVSPKIIAKNIFIELSEIRNTQ